MNHKHQGVCCVPPHIKKLKENRNLVSSQFKNSNLMSNQFIYKRIRGRIRMGNRNRDRIYFVVVNNNLLIIIVKFKLTGPLSPLKKINFSKILIQNIKTVIIYKNCYEIRRKMMTFLSTNYQILIPF